MVSGCLSFFCVRVHRGYFVVVSLYFGFRSPLSPLVCFIRVFFIISVSLWCFTDEDPYARLRTPMQFEPIPVFWSCWRIKGEVSRKSNWFEPPLLANKHQPVVFLLTVPRRSLFCRSSFLVRRWFRMWCLLCRYLFLIFLSLVPGECTPRDCGISWGSSHYTNIRILMIIKPIHELFENLYGVHTQ